MGCGIRGAIAIGAIRAKVEERVKVDIFDGSCPFWHSFLVGDEGKA